MEGKLSTMSKCSPVKAVPDGQVIRCIFLSSSLACPSTQEQLWLNRERLLEEKRPVHTPSMCSGFGCSTVALEEANDIERAKCVLELAHEGNNSESAFVDFVLTVVNTCPCSPFFPLFPKVSAMWG